MVTIDFMAERELESLKQENEALKAEIKELEHDLEVMIQYYRDVQRILERK